MHFWTSLSLAFFSLLETRTETANGDCKQTSTCVWIIPLPKRQIGVWEEGRSSAKVLRSCRSSWVWLTSIPYYYFWRDTLVNLTLRSPTASPCTCWTILACRLPWNAALWPTGPPLKLVISQIPNPCMGSFWSTCSDLGFLPLAQICRKALDTKKANVTLLAKVLTLSCKYM